jgi:hypothetical protein
MWRFVSMLRRTAWRRGVGQGRHGWFSLWVVIAAAQVIRRFTVAKPVVERMELRPGETIVVTDLGTIERL